MNLYQAFGVAEDASPETIKSAWKRLMRQYHPDVNPDPRAVDIAREINRCYEILKDPEKRRAYDAALAQSRRPAVVWVVAPISNWSGSTNTSSNYTMDTW